MFFSGASKDRVFLLGMPKNRTEGTIKRNGGKKNKKGKKKNGSPGIRTPDEAKNRSNSIFQYFAISEHLVVRFSTTYQRDWGAVLPIIQRRDSKGEDGLSIDLSLG